jgi:tetratricopeptide (TPR) repeat protein
MNPAVRTLYRALAGALLCAAGLCAQPPQGGRGGPFGSSPANQLDLDGKGAQARELFQKSIDSAATPRAKADADRAMAMSWAFEGNCAKTGEYEQKVIDYWAAQETADPANAFYQEGEIADEAARVCIDAGDLASAGAWYKKGHDLGLREPHISADRQALWEYRYDHALARLAARRGDRAEAQKYVAAAQASLEKMTALRAQQQAFLPYLTGYVAFYLGDYQAALADLQKANQNDPFIQCLIGMTYEKLGDQDKAMESYRKAYAAARAHNPPAAFARPFARKKLGL